MLASGTHIDRWIVVRPVGSSGVAEVYEVRHETLGSWQALKAANR